VRVAVDDIELYVHEKGEGRPLVALHGGPGLDGSFWFPGLDPLSREGWRILAPDLRANGRSDAGDPSRWTVPQMADDLEALIGALELERAVIAGWSFGSFVAQSHMARYGTAAACVLMGTIAEPDALEKVNDELARFEPERLREQVSNSWAREGTVTAADECRGIWHDQIPFHLADPEGPLVQELIARDEIVYRPEVLRHFAAGGEYGMVDYRSALSSFSKPVLVLIGAHDRTTSPESAHELASLLPNAEEVILPQTAHMVPYEEPELFLASLRSFLARV
jgi:pimeloyl-ACP methyl ester carboxylesterase